MPGGSVSVAITANTAGFSAGMSKVSQSAKSTAAAVKGSFSDSSLGFGKIGSSIDKGFAGIGKHSGSINTLSNGLLAVGVTAGIGVGVAVKRFAEFDQAMSNVKATGADAAGSLDQLRAAALDAGATTAFSATEAAQGVEALAKAGVSAQDVLGGGLSGALDLAAAGQTDVAFAAEAAASAMNQFGLAGADVPHIADLLAQAAGTAQGEVSDMAGALAQSGLIANQFGLSIDETAQALALFAKNGLVGSDAGTSFKTMLTSLYAPAGAGAKVLDKLGISAYDSTGALKEIGPLADELAAKLDGLSEGDRNTALRDIFGSDALRAGTILLKDGSAGLAQIATDFGKFGSAADVAATKMDNLNGDIENLTGSLETAFIGAGSGGNDFLRSLAQGATEAVNAFNDLDSATQGNVLKVTAVVGAAALAAGGLAKLVIVAAETRAALLALGVTATGVRARLAALSGSGLLAVAGFVAAQAASAALGDQLEKNSAGIDGYKASLDSLNLDQLDSQLGKFGDSWALAGQGVSDLDSTFRGFQDTLNPVSQGFRKVGDALGMVSTAGTFAAEMEKIDQALVGMDPDKAAAAFTRLNESARAAGLTTEEINTAFDDYKAKQLEAASVTGSAAAALRSSEIAFKNGASGAREMGAASQQAAEDIKAATDAMYAQANAALALSGNAIAVEAAMDAAAKAARDNGETLDINTEKGRANRQALNDLASATLTATQAMVENGESAGEIVATNERAKSSFIDTARAMGASKTEAREMADALFQIPAEIRSQVVIAGGKVSKQEAEELNAALKNIPAEKRAEIVTIAQTKGADAAYKAMAKVIDKEVTAATKGDPSGARKVKSEMDKLKDKLVKALARGDEKGATKVINEMKKLRDKTVTAKANAVGEGAVRSLIGSINGVKDKSVTVRVVTKKSTLGGVTVDAEGGLITHAGTMFRSAGGPVWGAGTATSDSIPAMLSNGEYVIKAASVLKLGVDRLQHMNQTGTVPSFAKGGPVGYATGGIVSGIPRGVDINRIYAMITALTRPLAAVVAANSVLGTARSVKAREDRELAAAKRAYERAVATDKRRNTKGSEAAKDKADAAYKKAIDQQKDATTKLTDATNNLNAAQQAVADSARQMSATLSDPYRSRSSNDVDDWLASMKEGAVDLKAFQGQLSQLRKLGVAETLVQQIAEKGAIAGSEVASQILAGGKALTTALNAANGNLQKAADALGYDVVQATGRYAAGGFVSGPGSGTSDSITARISNGEYVVNAQATAVNRSVLDAINYGRASSRPAFLPAYAHGGYVHNSSKEIRGGDLNVENVYVVDPDEFMRKGQRALQDSLNAASLRI